MIDEIQVNCWPDMSPYGRWELSRKILGLERTLDETAGILDYLQEVGTPPVHVVVDRSWEFVNASPDKNRGWLLERRLPYLWIKLASWERHGSNQYVAIPSNIDPDSSRVLLLYPDLYLQGDERPMATMVSSFELAVGRMETGQQSLTLDVKQFQHARNFDRQAGRQFGNEWAWLKMPDLMLHFVEQLGWYLHKSISSGEQLRYITLRSKMRYPKIEKLRMAKSYGDGVVTESLYSEEARYHKEISKIIPDVRLQREIERIMVMM